MISGEDKITVDKKYADPFTVKLPTRLVIMSNDLPRFKDTSGALAHRMIILPLAVSFLGREDPTIGARLLRERPGILTWAVAGWKRLKERGRFVPPESGRPLHEGPNPTLTLVANSFAHSRSLFQGSEPRTSRLRIERPSPPVIEPDHIDRRRCQDMLQVRLGPPDIAASP